MFYNWLVFLHILSSFLLMLGHGAHVAAMLKFRAEPDPGRTLSFFNALPDIKYVRYITAAAGVFGFAAAFMAGWLTAGWVWASFAIFLLIWFVMYKYGAGYYGLMFGAASRLVEALKTGADLPLAQKAFDDARKTSHTTLVSIVGIAGLAVILWLMRFKPF